MARLSISKRTKQLDDAREVLLKNGFHSTVGGMTVQPLHKEQAASNIRATARMGMVRKVVEAVFNGAADFFRQRMIELVPAGLNCDDETAFNDWLCTEGYSFRQDGLTSILLRQGKIVVTQTATVNPSIVAEVLAEIKRQQEGA